MKKNNVLKLLTEYLCCRDSLVCSLLNAILDASSTSSKNVSFILLSHSSTGCWEILPPEKKISKFRQINWKFVFSWNQSRKGISGSVCEFISNFLRQIVKKRGQKLILGDNFIDKNSDDFYVLQLWFFDISGLDFQK